jgi:predicted transcriptional regulator
LIEEGRVIVDLIDEAINRSGLSKDSITLVIPFNFSEIQRGNYLKAAEIAGLTNISFIDEQTALAFGYEDKYDAIHGIEYLLINISDKFTKITLNKVGEFDKGNCLQKIIDSENYDLSKLTFFDNIINSAKGNNTEIVDFDVHLQNLFDAVNELITNATNLTTIVVSNEIYYAFLQDYFPNFNIIVLENCEKLIVKGAALA